MFWEKERYAGRLMRSWPTNMKNGLVSYIPMTAKPTVKKEPTSNLPAKNPNFSWKSEMRRSPMIEQERVKVQINPKTSFALVQ